MYLLSTLFFSATIGLTCGLNVSEPGSVVRRSPQTCGDPADALPFYRTYNPTAVDHCYTTDITFLNDIVRTDSYPVQGVAAFVFVTQEESTVPFYHLHSVAATDSFYTISTTERDNALKNGYIVLADDPVTYIYPTQVCGSIPFYRLYQQTGQDNFYTISEAERLDFIANRGYTDIEIAGYVLPATPSSQCD